MRNNSDAAPSSAVENRGISLDEARRQSALYDFVLQMTAADATNLEAGQQPMVETGMPEVDRMIGCM